MSYKIVIKKRVHKKLAKIPQKYNQKICQAITDLAINPRPPGCIKLEGRPAWRIRVGIYRVIYEIGDGQLIITVIDVGHRRDIYR